MGSLQLPRFWHRQFGETKLAGGTEQPFSVWGWSLTSLDEAISKAKSRASALMQSAPGLRCLKGSYDYDRVPPREEILEEFQNSSGEIVAAITRNRYGAKVLNTAQVMFVDIDLPPIQLSGQLSGSVASLFKRLISKEPLSQENPAQKNPAEEDALGKLRDFSSRNPSWGFRVYRTAAGLRYLVTHDLFEPSSAASLRTLQELGSDPQFTKLCQVQNSFRARLTPKPWRCGMAAPTMHYPFSDTTFEQQYRRWVADYEARCTGFATCALLSTVGVDRVHPLVAKAIEVHDRGSAVGVEKPLA